MRCSAMVPIAIFLPFSLIVALTQTHAQTSTAGERIRNTKVIARVPMEDGRLNVQINNKGPLRFGFDSGASGNAWISWELADELQLPVVRHLHAHAHDGTSGGGTTLDVVRIETLTIGDAPYRDLLAFVKLRKADEADSNAAGRGHRVRGTLGLELFRDQLVTFDFPGHMLIIGYGELPKTDGQNIMDFTLNHSTPVIPIILGPLKITAEVDTGGAGEIMVPLSLAQKLPLDTPLVKSGEVASAHHVVARYTATLNGDLTMGSFVIPHPKLLCSDLLPYVNLGRDLLHQFAITFDQRNHRLELARPVR